MYETKAFDSNFEFQRVPKWMFYVYFFLYAKL